MTVLHDIKIDTERLATLCRCYKVRRLWFFGSILGSTFGGDSDVDVLAEMSLSIGLFRLGEFQEDLSDLFGRSAHVTTYGSVPTLIRTELLRSARLEYAA